MKKVIAQTELDSIVEILSKNQDKNFIQRILKPDNFPTIPLSKGKVGTHLMADSEIDGMYIAYPTIVFIDGKLKHLSNDEAIDYAINSGEFVEFPTDTAAAWFAKNYKKYWNDG